MLRRLLAYTQRHPLLALEHLALTAILLAYVRDRRLTCGDGAEPCCCPSGREGPQTVFGLPGVSKAPPPSMDVSKLRDGEVAAHHDNRGDIYRFRLGDGVVLNMYKTLAGNKRSGDLHNCTQFNVIMEGAAELTTLDVESGRERVRRVQPNEFVRIPARTPHLYEFPVDTYLLEWWACPFEAYYYEPYRKRIST